MYGLIWVVLNQATHILCWPTNSAGQYRSLKVQVLHFQSRHWSAELVGCLWNAFHKHDWIVTKQFSHACRKDSTSIQQIHPENTAVDSARLELLTAVFSGQVEWNCLSRVRRESMRNKQERRPPTATTRGRMLLSAACHPTLLNKLYFSLYYCS